MRFLVILSTLALVACQTPTQTSSSQPPPEVRCIPTKITNNAGEIQYWLSICGRVIQPPPPAQEPGQIQSQPETSSKGEGQ